ncbi:MAG: GNAT family N-acetyltransferase [Candidatus Thorarchaeota archaeon]|jgi:N-acetylglutamate synthase-like GNAT family acetyltransferase
MVKIRNGVMKDCKDLLEVYMGTRWSEGFTTVEQVKLEHKGVAFEKWGWLVAEIRGKVVGEILCRVEKNPVAGKIGLIRSLGIDVRHQKKAIGTKLTKAAEKALRLKKAGRFIATTTPEAYNYWMKVDYHKRYWVLQISAAPSRIPSKKSKKLRRETLPATKKLPKTMRFSNIAYPGELAEVVREIVTNEKPGLMLEFFSQDVLMGVGAAVKDEDNTAKFIADITPKGADFADLIILQTAKAAAKLKPKKVWTLIPQDKLPWYKRIVPWRSEMHRNFPVTKLA